MPKTHPEIEEQLRSMLEADQSPAAWEQQLNQLDSADLLHAVFQLKPHEQRQLLSAVSVERAAEPRRIVRLLTMTATSARVIRGAASVTRIR